MSGDEDKKSDEGFADGEESDVIDVVGYSLQRLVRGLSAERDSSKRGYFVCLVELLRQHEDVTFKDVTNVIDKTLNLHGSKSEEGSTVCGKILAYGAVLRSQRFAEKRAEIVKELVGLSSKKSYARPLGHYFLVDLISSSNVDEVKTDVWPAIRGSRQWKGDDLSLESLWILLEIQDKTPTVLEKRFLIENFDSDRLISQTFAAEAGKMLLVSFEITSIYWILVVPQIKCDPTPILKEGLLNFSERLNSSPNSKKKPVPEATSVGTRQARGPLGSVLDPVHQPANLQMFLLQDHRLLLDFGCHSGQRWGARDDSEVPHRVVS